MENFAENVQSGAVQVGTPAMAQAEQPLTLSDVIGADETSTAQQPQMQTTQTPAQPETTAPQQEPGWFQGRLQKEQAKWEKKHEAEMTQLREQQNALMERLLDREAQDLVASGEVKSIETAKELLRLRAGLPSAQQPSQPQQPRDESGRFLPKQDNTPDAASQQRAVELVAQADVLKRVSGVDVMAIYNTDPNARQKVLSGEWDFADVLQNHPVQQPAAQQTPTPIRGSSGIGIGTTSVSTMSDASFKKMNELLSRGKVIDMRK